jgi:hypothetical protein
MRKYWAVVTAVALASSLLESSPLKLAVTQQGEILSGGPSPTEARRALEQRIKQQSSARIALLEFAPLNASLSDVELDDSTFCQVEFTALIEFTEPCLWAVRHQGRPLTFQTLPVPGQPDPSGASVFPSIHISSKGERYSVNGSVLFRPEPDGWLPAGFAAGRNPQPAEAADAERCAENLKRLGLALELACMDHEDRYPFSVSTNLGGTLELQSPGPDGFDQNTHLHLRGFSQQLLDPADLVCPTDTARRPARTLSDLHPDSLSYQLRTGATREPGHGTDVLATCSLHGHHLHVDGTVRKADRQ